MATWSDIQRHMRDAYRLQSDEPQVLSMVWSYDDGRSQRIIVRRFEAAGRDMVEFKSPFAKLGSVDPLDMLRENARLPFGAVALSGEILLVVHNQDIGALEVAQFDFLLSKVAGIADKLETRYAAEDVF